MSRQKPIVKITVEFPLSKIKHHVALFATCKARVFDWRYNGVMRGEITPTALLKRLCKWIGDYDYIKAGIKV
ncbi:MAG: hypothetical protein KAT71_08365 [Gammaproteobacteria bacterium]|nr:hypothetical protein [Gammaproteobacteria bacterium]